MNVWQWLKTDLARPSRPIGRDELPFLGFAALVIVVAAQWSEPGTTTDLVLLVVAGVALVLMGAVDRGPIELFTAAVLGPVIVAVGHEGHLELSLFLVVTATLYASWHLGSTTRAGLITVVSTIAIVWTSFIHVDGYSWAPWVAAEAFTLVLGRTLYSQGRLINELESAREALAVEAVAEERRRIAMELHDLAGHTLAAMLLNVTGARHVLRRDLAEADQALADAEAVGRTSMGQIRATVAALRTTETGTDPPVPDAGDLHLLIDEYRRAGLRVTASVAPEVSDLDSAVGLAVHRISREALANVARHASDNDVTLDVSTDPTERTLLLVVADHGARPPPNAVRPGRFGIVGMGERARSVGGTLIAEATDDGWRVEAVLPLSNPDAERTKAPVR